MKIVRPKSSYPVPKHATRVFEGEIFDVYQWEQTLYNGSTATFEKLKRPDTVQIVPVLEDKILVNFEQQPGQVPYLGLVGGRVDRGESPLQATKRELLEETGYQADYFSLLDAVQPVSKIDWAIYYFVVRDMRKVSEKSLDGGEKIETRRLTFSQFIEAIEKERIKDPLLLSMVLRAKLNTKVMQVFKHKILGS